MVLPTPKERRRSRKKPPVGCSMCRRRRIRCDKEVPKCRNCISQACDCEYAALPKSGASVGAKVKKTIPGERIVPVLTLAMMKENNAKKTPPTKQTIEKAPVIDADPLSAVTKRSSEGGTPDRIQGGPSPALSPTQQLPPNYQKLLYHMSSIAMSIDSTKQTNVVIYLKPLPTFLMIADRYDFVMYGLMAWAASHMAFSTNSFEAQVVSRQFRGMAMKGLQKAISRFSERNSDAVLAASLLLSWQAADPREWATLNQGTCTVLTALTPWSSQSLFADYIADDHVYAAAPNVIRTPINFLTSGSITDEASALHYIYSALDRVAAYSQSHPAEYAVISALMAFVQNVENHLPITHPAMRFKLCVPVRSMLYWYPAQLYDAAQFDPVTMVTLAHLYAISLTVQPVFAGPGAAHFRGLSTVPIEEIYKRLEDRHQRNKGRMETFIPLSLMDFPMQSVSLFRSRIGLSVENAVNIDQSLEGIHIGLDPGAIAEARDLGLSPGPD